MKTAKELALMAARALSDKKGREIQVLEIGDLTTLADYFVIATGTSSTQVKSLSDYVETELKEQGVQPLHQEGYASSSWVLLDYGDVVVHIFTEQTRGFYDLERLWKDGAQLPLSDFLPEAED